MSSSMDLAVKRESVYVSVDSAEYRTRVWVSVLPSVSFSDADLEVAEHGDAAGVQRRREFSSAPATGIIPPAPFVGRGSDAPSQLNPPPLVAQAASVDGSNPSCSLVVADEGLVLARKPQSLLTLSCPILATDATETRNRVMSRAGRLFKPVYRLIEMMHQRTELASHSLVFILYVYKH